MKRRGRKKVGRKGKREGEKTEEKNNKHKKNSGRMRDIEGGRRSSKVRRRG